MTTQNLIKKPGAVPLNAFIHAYEEGDVWGQEIGEFLSLGRDGGCSLTFNDASISGRHARIERTEKGYLLRDLRSRNGTFVNGARILEAYLNDGDRIQIGRTQLLFSLKRNLNESTHFLSSRNEAWSQTLSQLGNLAQSDLPILILGPSGTGKELIAKSLHEKSSRKAGPLVSVNCSALSEALIESELFGHVRGSFTGATDDRKGAFEAARGGTLFLDEVGDLPLSLQPKLLRALENKEIRPVGKDESVKTDVRIVTATHHDLREKVYRGQFRLDLYYRLNVLQIKSPALIERMEDFEDLLNFFCKEQRVSIKGEALNALKDYQWPGNIRELKNVVAKAKAFFDKEVSTLNQVKQLIEIPFTLKTESPETDAPEKAPENPVNSSLLKELEYELIKKRLAANKGNQRQTALDLGIPKSTLHDRIKLYKLKIPKASE